MRKISIIGAGISGLSVANFLKEKHHVEVFEQEDSPGGLIRCKQLPEGLFHLCGGHVFNTKLKDVQNWFWSVFCAEDFTKAKRQAAIAFPDSTIIQYPIENHVYQLPTVIQESFRQDLGTICECPPEECASFDEFLLRRFGRTLYDLYFHPYNTKIWQRDLTTIPTSWLYGKLPMPSVDEMRAANRQHLEEENFVHSSFWYEKKQGSQFIANTLAKGLSISYNTKIREIRRLANRKYLVNGQTYDEVFFCGNIKDLPKLLKGVNLARFEAPIQALKSHGTTTAFCEIDKNPYSWIYLPSPDYSGHRIICTGNFAPSNNTCNRCTASIEFSNDPSAAEMLASIARMPFNPRLITSHFSKHSYPIQNQGTRKLIADIRSFLRPLNIHLVGRFAEWEYYNMDAAISSAMKETAFN